MPMPVRDRRCKCLINVKSIEIDGEDVLCKAFTYAETMPVEWCCSLSEGQFQGGGD
jgi:hypothetical protein